MDYISTSLLGLWCFHHSLTAYPSLQIQTWQVNAPFLLNVFYIFYNQESRAIFKLAAIQLTEAMDPTVNPCQDFFQYACGGWIKKNPIPASKSGWSQFDIMYQKLTHILKGEIRILFKATVAYLPEFNCVI